VSLSTRVLLSLILLLLPGLLNAQPNWKYFRTGSDADIVVKPLPGFALMGGGANQEAAFQFLCEQNNGGDFLILRADTDEAYATKVNKEISAVCPLNSVATIVFSEREDSDDAKVVQIIDRAETIFIAGGDQSNYLRFWQDTPVQEALNRHILTGKPIGGSSAGLAVLGEYSFASIIDTIHSPEALANPYGNKVTLSRDFLKIPLLAGTITDTHFVKRDRLGRLLVFMARISQDGWSKRVRAIGVDENAAVLVKSDGSAQVVGEGPAYFLESTAAPSTCSYRQPLTFENIKVQRIRPGKTFQISTWKGNGESYSLSVVNGVVNSTNAEHSSY
jgi:cyanophycinase